MRIPALVLGPISCGERLALRPLLRRRQAHGSLKHIRIEVLLVGLVREDLARALAPALGLELLVSFLLPPIGADGGAGRRPAAVVAHRFVS